MILATSESPVWALNTTFVFGKNQGTLVVICVFLLTFGGTTQLMLHCLQIRTGPLAGAEKLLGAAYATEGRKVWSFLWYGSCQIAIIWQQSESTGRI